MFWALPALAQLAPRQRQVVESASSIAVKSTSSTTARPLSERFAATRDPRDFGAIVDGRSDDTEAWNLAIAAIEREGGGVLFVPPGTSRVEGPLKYKGDNLSIVGSGYVSAIVKFSLRGNLFDFSGNKYLFDSFLLDAPNDASAGTLFALNTSTGNVTIGKVLIDGGYNVLALNKGAQLHISDSTFNNFVHDGIRPGAAWGGLTTIHDVIMNVDGAVNRGACLFFEAGDTFTLTNINAASCHYPIKLMPPPSTALLNVFATNVLADGVGRRDSGGPGWTIDGTAAGSALRRVRITNSWAGINYEDGFKIVGSDDVAITNSIAINNRRNGIYAAKSSTNMKFIGNSITGSSFGAPGAYSGIRIDSAVSNFLILGNSIRPIAGVDNTQNYGIDIEGPGNGRYIIRDNDLDGNRAAAIKDGGISLARQSGANIGVREAAGISVTKTFGKADGTGGTFTLVFTSGLLTSSTC